MNGLSDSPSWTELDVAVALLNDDSTKQVFEQTLVVVTVVQSRELHTQSAEVEIWLSCVLVGH